MSKKITFYTNQENNLLKEYAKTKAPVNTKLLGQFCKDYNRSLHSARIKVYEFRKQMGIDNSRAPRVKRNNPVMPVASLIKNKSVATVSKGEFKIPINSWNVSNENGQFYFIVKF